MTLVIFWVVSYLIIIIIIIIIIFILTYKNMLVKSNYRDMKTCELDYKATSDTDNNPEKHKP